MVVIQVRFPEKLVKQIDKMVKRGEFASRSDAIRAMVRIYEYIEARREFIKMLDKRSKEMDKGKWVSLDEI